MLVEFRQPAVVRGPPGSTRSDIAQQVAAGRKYVDVRALLLDRLTHDVHIQEMNGKSYRLAQSRSKRKC